jgi:signal transduction histidine kinase
MAGNAEALLATLDRVTRLVDGSGFGPTVPLAVRERARGHALELVEAESSSAAGADAIARLAFTAEIFFAIAVDLAARPREARRLIDGIEQIAGVPRPALGREALRAPDLSQLPADLAIEVQLALLLAFTEVRAVSLWMLSPAGELRHVSHAGEFDPAAREGRRAASALIAAKDGPREVGTAVGIRIKRWEEPAAALLAHGQPARGDHRGLLLEAAVPVLSLILERDELLNREQRSGQSVVSSVERRLARLRFDLHDGPQQDVHLLAQDLRQFRDQLRPMIADDRNAHRVLAGLDDLEAQLVALDGDLRRISTAVESPFLAPGSLPQALKQITDAFAGRAGLEPNTRLEGDLTNLSESQQLTLLALIREGLSNIREHSDAKTVTITISSGGRGVEARVVDDGRGFDPESTLIRAAREGHLGLVGMHERVRMLGGRTRIESQPGGPTIISVSLPQWPPDQH